MPRTGRLDLRRRVIVADDATGALEAGALAGAVVHLDDGSPSPPQAGSAEVRMLPTRHVESAKAREMVLREALPRWSEAHLYWKTDSTLRGRIGTCFEALLEAFPDRRIVYCPAYPALGRTVRDGMLYVHGVPLHDTEFARDPHHPMRSSSVREAVGIPDTETRLHIFNAETEAEVRAICGEAAEDAQVILAGPAGGIRYWICGADGSPAQTHSRVWPRVEPRQWLVVCGSMHPLSLQQARETNLTVFGTADGDLANLAGRAARSGAKAMLLFGGDTALAVWKQLGLHALVPLGEILPGVAASTSIDGEYVFVTKAGGFGGPGLIAAILERWKTQP